MDSDGDDDHRAPKAIRADAAQPALYRSVVHLSQVFGLLGDAYGPDGRPAGVGQQWLRPEAFEVLALGTLFNLLKHYLVSMMSKDVMPESVVPRGFMGLMRRKREGWTA